MSHRVSRALLIAGLLCAAPAIAAAAPHQSARESAAKEAAAQAHAWKAYAYADQKLSFEAPRPPKVGHDGGSTDLSADYTIAGKNGTLMISAVDLTGLTPRPSIRDPADTAGEIYRVKPKVTPSDVPGGKAVDWSLHAANGTDLIGRVIDVGRFEYRVSALLTYADAPDPAAKARLKTEAERFIKSVAVTP